MVSISHCSVAILRYLCREHEAATHLYPKDSKLQAKVDEYLEWQHVNTRLSCAMFFQHKVSFYVLKMHMVVVKRIGTVPYNPSLLYMGWIGMYEEMVGCTLCSMSVLCFWVWGIYTVISFPSVCCATLYDSAVLACFHVYVCTTVHVLVMYWPLFFFQFLMPMMLGTKVNEKKVEDFKRRMETVLEQFETIWLKDKPFVAGNQVTIADLLAACELEQPSM